MSQKIAVAIIHGVGKDDPDFASGITQKLKKWFAKYLLKERKNVNPFSELVIEPIYWAPILQIPENTLWQKIRQGGELCYNQLRRFMIDYGADAIAYQLMPKERQIYDNIHQVFAQSLKKLANNAGGKAPLCVIAHSLGSVIASNYFYDLQYKIFPATVKNTMTPNIPLENGETFTLFYTMGSPIAIWSLRYQDFGIPISVPSPDLKKYHSNLEGEWINYYSKYDVLSYPLKTLNKTYQEKVTADKNIRVGGCFYWWNPFSHLKYWTDNDITKPIAKSLAKVWKAVNP